MIAFSYFRRRKSKNKWKSELMKKDVSVCLLKKLKVPGVHYASKILIDGRLAISSNSDILIFNLSNWKCELIIKGNSNTIIDIVQLKNGKLITISDDIKIYSITQNCYKCEHTFKECNHPKQIVELNNNTILCLDETLYFTVVNIEKPYNIIRKIDTNQRILYDMIYQCKSKDLLLSSFHYYKELNVWSSVTYQQIATFDGVECPHYKTIVEYNNKILFCAEKVSIFIIDLTKYTFEAAYYCYYIGRKTFSCIITFRDKILLLGDNKGVFQIFDFEKNVLKVLPIHETEIQNIFLMDNNTIMTISNDKYIKIWNLIL